MTATPERPSPPEGAVPYAASRQFTDEEITVEVAKWLHLVWCKDAGHSYGEVDRVAALQAVQWVRDLRGSAPAADRQPTPPAQTRPDEGSS